MAARTPPAPDLARWEAAISHRASFVAARRLRLLGDDAPATRLLEARVHADGEVEHVAWLAGPRGRMTTGLQRLLTDALGAERRWYLPWILGRWPRGAVTLGLALDGLARDRDELHLGIIAPLTPTRVALSESPRPLHREAVAHFKALHLSTGAAGLSGCRMRMRDGEVGALVGRWSVTSRALQAAAEHMGLPEATRAALIPAIEGLAQGLPSAQLALEVAYSPDPEPRLTVEVGPLPIPRVLGLTAGEGTAAADGGALEALGADLAQRGALRARLECDADGLRAVGVLVAARGQGIKRSTAW